MINIKIRKTSKRYQLLKDLTIASGILILSLAAPVGGAKLIQETIKLYFKNKKFEKNRFLSDLRNLQNREIISYQELADDKIKIVLTKKGEKKMLEYKMDETFLKPLKYWDKKWRIVMFDIPHPYKKNRDAFRKKLSKMNFYPIQKSVFITPCPCDDEIDFVASVLNIRKYVLIFNVISFDGEEKLRNYFHLN